MPCDAKLAKVYHTCEEKKLTICVTLLGKEQPCLKASSSERRSPDPHDPEAPRVPKIEVVRAVDDNTPLALRFELKAKGPVLIEVKIDGVVRLIEPHKLHDKPFIIDEVFCKYLRCGKIYFERANMVARPQVDSTTNVDNCDQELCTIEVEFHNCGPAHTEPRIPMKSRNWKQDGEVIDPRNRSGSRIDFYPVTEITKADMNVASARYGGGPSLYGSTPLLCVKFKLVSFENCKKFLRNEVEQGGGRKTRTKKRTYIDFSETVGTMDSPIVLPD